MGILEGLLVLFIALKLLGVIDWSWWWVFAPLFPGMLFWAFVVFSCVWESR